MSGLREKASGFLEGLPLLWEEGLIPVAGLKIEIPLLKIITPCLPASP